MFTGASNFQGYPKCWLVASQDSGHAFAQCEERGLTVVNIMDLNNLKAKTLLNGIHYGCGCHEAIYNDFGTK